MRLVRVKTPTGIVGGTYRDGIVTTDGGESHEIGDDVVLEAPCVPSAVYCLGRNFATTVEGEGATDDRPEEPSFFVKPPASVFAPNAAFEYPRFTDELGCAGELAAVIDERCRNVERKNAAVVIRGYTILNDLDALDQPSVSARKVFEGSSPIGPWIETDLDPTEIAARTTVNGGVVQEGTTASMLFEPFEVVEFLSERVTLRPGDVIAFGGPGVPVPVDPGDVVEITYEGIGTLRNEIVTDSR